MPVVKTFLSSFGIVLSAAVLVLVIGVIGVIGVVGV